MKMHFHFSQQYALLENLPEQAYPITIHYYDGQECFVINKDDRWNDVGSFRPQMKTGYLVTNDSDSTEIYPQDLQLE